MARKTTKKDKSKPQLHEDLEGFDIKINSFGEIRTTFDIGRINDFLNKNVEDKKLNNKTESKEEE